MYYANVKTSWLLCHFCASLPQNLYSTLGWVALYCMQFIADKGHRHTAVYCFQSKGDKELSTLLLSIIQLQLISDTHLQQGNDSSLYLKRYRPTGQWVRLLRAWGPNPGVTSWANWIWCLQRGGEAIPYRFLHNVLMYSSYPKLIKYNTPVNAIRRYKKAI